MWLLEGKDWVPATVTESKGGQVTFHTEYDKVGFIRTTLNEQWQCESACFTRASPLPVRVCKLTVLSTFYDLSWQSNFLKANMNSLTTCRKLSVSLGLFTIYFMLI